jgi:tetratricopeptide (TPR) repeat protein
VSSTSSNNFSVARLARRISTYTTLAGLTFSGIRHRDDVVEWLKQSYDRKEILKEFARLKESQTAAIPSAAPESSATSSPDVPPVVQEKGSDEREHQPMPQASQPKSDPNSPMRVAESAPQKMSSASESPTEPHSSEATSAPSSAPAPKPLTQEDTLRTSYLELQQRYKLVHEQFEAFRMLESWRQPAEISRVVSSFEAAEQQRVLLEEELAARNYGERFKGALQSLRELVEVVESPIQAAVRDAQAAQEYRDAHERIELFHLGRSAITEAVDTHGLLAGVRYFKAARMDGPLNIAAKVELATLYHMLGRNDEALVEVNRVIDSEDGEVIPPVHDIPDWQQSAAFEAYMLLGRLYRTEAGGKDLQQAVKALQTARTYATDSNQMKDIGSELVRCDQPKEALRLWGAVLNASPDRLPEIWKEFTAVGAVPAHQETFAELVKQIASDHEDSPAAQRALVSVELPEAVRLADHLSTDIKSFEKATKGPLPAEVVLAKQCLSNGREEIQTISAELKSVGPDSKVGEGSVPCVKATLLLAGDLLAQATGHAQTAQELITRFDESHLRERAKTLIDSERQPKIRQAIAYLKAARSLHDDPIISNNLGLAYKLLGQYDEAKIEFLRAIIAAPLEQPAFYSNFFDYCVRAIAQQGDGPRYQEVKRLYLDEAGAGNTFMACYAAAIYYTGESPQRIKEWLELAAEEISQGRAADVRPEFVADCEARLRAFR